MDVRRRGACSVEILRGGQRGIFLDAALHPDLVDPTLLPIGKQAHNVADRDDLIEMLSDLRHWQVEVDILPHRERGLEIQSDLGDDADGTEVDDSGLKHLEISVAREREDIAVGTHNLECRNRRREVPVPRAGAVRRGGTRAGN